MPISVPVASIRGPCSICASSQQAQPRGDGTSGPAWPLACNASRTLTPRSSVIASASSSTMSAAWTRLPIIAGRKRLPSSLVQFTSSSGARVSIPASSRARITSSPASTPNTPSKRPPVGTVSRWLPKATAGAVPSLPSRRRNMLPIASCSKRRSSGRDHASSNARASASSGVSARRQLPPSGVGPMPATSMTDCQSRSALIDGVMGCLACAAGTAAVPPAPVRAAGCALCCADRRPRSSGWATARPPPEPDTAYRRRIPA